jgi:hypothetical protein
MGQSFSCCPQFQLFAHSPASLPKSPLWFTWNACMSFNDSCFPTVLSVNDVLLFLQCFGLVKSLFRLLDKNLTYHRHIAYMICIFSG